MVTNDAIAAIAPHRWLGNTGMRPMSGACIGDDRLRRVGDDAIPTSRRKEVERQGRRLAGAAMHRLALAETVEAVGLLRRACTIHERIRLGEHADGVLRLACVTARKRLSAIGLIFSPLYVVGRSSLLGRANFADRATRRCVRICRHRPSGAFAISDAEIKRGGTNMSKCPARVGRPFAHRIICPTA